MRREGGGVTAWEVVWLIFRCRVPACIVGWGVGHDRHKNTATDQYDNKMVKSPFNCIIFPLTQPQVAKWLTQKKYSWSKT